MSRKGNCWDNAQAESFFETLKSELNEYGTFRSREEASREVFEQLMSRVAA
jgi:putative transposase